ncbi:MAG: maleylpyruvate isomerase N-terminal domain-containing protein [Ilumatobacteraceae bacterium]|jgi:uncharacterized protein (TIGR03083 family)|nr:maleylpyruvate isomerase N-terminal domain-containing protein [Ilumatobacteraceae bacterium]
MSAAALDVTSVEPLDHDEAMALHEAELAVTLRFLRTLSDDDWGTTVPDCPAWDVRQMYLHVLGACEGAAMGQMVHQMTAAMRRRRTEGGPLEANLSAVQVADRAHLSPAQLLERLAAVAPRVIRQRRRMPSAVRRGVRMQVDGPVVERWRLGYLVDIIYLRDLWMHRIDACRAIGRAPELGAAHDGRIVADVVVEWARRHGQPFALELTGDAGGSFAGGCAGEEITMDAVEFCRVLSGRGPADGLLTTIVPF